MTSSLFVDGWTVRRADDSTAQAVALPHDAMISETRAPDAASSYHGAYFPGGTYVYEKTWTPEASPRIALLFEGVYGDTRVILNGVEIAANRSPYREFLVELDGALIAGENHLEVHVDNSRLPNSRWYTGSGIYRPVWEIRTDATRFARDGVSIRTVAISPHPRVEIRTRVYGDVPAGTQVRVVLSRGDSVVAATVGPVGTFAMEVPGAAQWTAETPHLYDVELSLLSDGRALEVRTFKIGIRTVEVDAARGLRINGDVVKLRGACVHHDSGVLGAATFRAAEFRRARILKANGYNAVRSSHNPLSRDFIDACDEVGLYVLDELTDVWFAPKTSHDLAEGFENEWPDDLRSLVAKDRNHPSVIMYSLGNEIAGVGLPRGVDATRRISEMARDLDPDRPTTVAANFLLAVLASRGKSMFRTEEKPKPAKTKKVSAVTSTVANTISNKIGSISQLISKLPAADKATRDAFPEVDVAGYNYAWSRYAADAKRYPERVILGTESMPGDLPKIWNLVERLPNVIGDFVWTGWDYLGESGLGTWAYGSEPAALTKPYPQLTSGCGTIDITGHAGAEMFLARAVWGELPAPAITVRPLDRAHEKTVRMAWRFTDAVESWAWKGKEGTPAEIEVYSDADHIDLHLNGAKIGRRRVVNHVARFRTSYQPGVLTAVAYAGRNEISRSEIRSASDASLTLTAERDTLVADGQDLCFVRVEIRDESGVVEMLADDDIDLEVTGPAVLAGFGSAAPATTESFTGATHRSYYGRALAVLRSTGQPGAVTLTARTAKGDTVTTTVQAVPTPSGIHAG